jgi:hypothetical protein
MKLVPLFIGVFVCLLHYTTSIKVSDRFEAEQIVPDVLGTAPSALAKVSNFFLLRKSTKLK